MLRLHSPCWDSRFQWQEARVVTCDGGATRSYGRKGWFNLSVVWNARCHLSTFISTRPFFLWVSFYESLHLIGYSFGFHIFISLFPRYSTNRRQCKICGRSDAAMDTPKWCASYHQLLCFDNWRYCDVMAAAKGFWTDERRCEVGAQQLRRFPRMWCRLNYREQHGLGLRSFMLSEVVSTSSETLINCGRLILSASYKWYHSLCNLHRTERSLGFVNRHSHVTSCKNSTNARPHCGEITSRWSHHTSSMWWLLRRLLRCSPPIVISFVFNLHKSKHKGRMLSRWSISHLDNL